MWRARPIYLSTYTHKYVCANAICGTCIVVSVAAVVATTLSALPITKEEKEKADQTKKLCPQHDTEAFSVAVAIAAVFW